MSKFTVTLTENDQGNKVTTYQGDNVSVLAMDEQRIDDEHVAIVVSGALMGFGSPVMLESILSSYEDQIGKEKFAALLVSWMTHHNDRKAFHINIKEGADQA